MYLEILGEDPVVANNGLESWNRTWNQEMGTNPNMWKIVQGFVNQESENKRILVSNAAGRDMNTNTGRKSLVKKQYVRIGGIVQQYNTLAIEQYLNFELLMSCRFIKLIVLGCTWFIVVVNK